MLVAVDTTSWLLLLFSRLCFRRLLLSFYIYCYYSLGPYRIFVQFFFVFFFRCCSFPFLIRFFFVIVIHFLLCCCCRRHRHHHRRRSCCYCCYRFIIFIDIEIFQSGIMLSVFICASFFSSFVTIFCIAKHVLHYWLWDEPSSSSSSSRQEINETFAKEEKKKLVCDS